MTHCVNINHKDIKVLSEQLKLPNIIVAAKVALWQENNTMDRFPTVEELLPMTKDSIEKSLKGTKFFSQHNGLLFIKKNFYPQAIKEIAKYNIKTPGLITVKKANNFGAGGREIYYIKINENLLTPDVPTQGSLFSTSKIKPGVAELFESNPELASIGTPEQYSQYLDTIFPDSQVSDIVYHGTMEHLLPKDKFKGYVTYFTTSKRYAETFGFPVNRKVLAAKINVERPYNAPSEMADVPEEVHITDKFTNPRLIKANNREHDSVIGKDAGQEEGNTVAIFEPEQIHILGSARDLNMFERFVSTDEVSVDTNPNEELNQILINFLSQFGISAQAMNTTLRKGDYTIKAFVDFARKMIRWAKGYESEIPEEAAHMIFELLDSNIKESIINMVMKTQRFVDFKQANPGLYNTDREYAKEVAGQMLTEEIKSSHAGLQKMKPSPLDNMFQRFIKFLKNLFSKGDISTLENEIKTKLGELADQVLKGETTNLNVKNLSSDILFSSEKEIVAQQISSLEQRIELAQKIVKPGENRKLRSSKITKMKNDLKRLEFNKNLIAVFNVAWGEYRKVSTLLTKEDLTPEQIDEINLTIGRLEALVSMTEPDTLSDKLRVNFKELKDRLTQLVHLANKRESSVIERLAIEQGMDMTSEQLLAPVEDVGILKTEFMSLDSSNVPLLNLAASIFEDVRRQRREEFLEYKKKSNLIRAKFKKEDFAKYFDKNGRLILKTKGEYFEEERKMLERLSLLMEETTDKYERARLYKERAEWYRQRNKYELTEEGKALFEEHLAEIIESYKDGDGNISEEDRKEIERWKTENNPETGIRYATTGVYTKGNIGWFRYLSATPLEVNPEYEKIKNDEAYKFIIETLQDGLRRLPHRMTLDVGNFDKAINEIVFSINKSPFFENIWEGFKDFGKETFMVELTEADIKGEEIGVVDEKGQLRPVIRAKNPSLLQKEGNFSNPIDLMDKLMEVAIAYEHKVKAESKIAVIQSALEKQKAIKVNRGSFAIKRKDIYNTVEGGLRNAQEMLAYNAQAELYNMVRTDEDKVKPTQKQLNDFKLALEKWREEATKAAQENKPIPPKPTLPLLSAVKSTDALIDFTRMNLLGLKPFSATANLLIGLESNYVYAARNKDFNDADLNWAFRKLMGNVVKYWTGGKLKVTEEVEKIANLAHKHGVTNETLFEDANKYSSKVSAFLFAWQTGGEFIIATQLLLAKLRHTKVTDLAGKERSLYDAFDKDGNWKTKEFGEQQAWTTENYMVEGKNESKLRKFNNEFKNVRKRTQGDYMDAMKFKSKVWGRLFMIFRTWLPRAVNERFGEQVGEDFKGRYRTYGNLINNIREQRGTASIMTDILRFLSVVTAKSANLPVVGHLGFRSISELASEKYEKHLKELGMTDLDIENMRANVREGQFILYLLLLGLALKGLAGEDDEELTYLTNLANRLFQDVTFFYSFNSAFAIIKDPLPVYKTIQDIYDVTDAGFGYLQDPESDVYQRGFREGKSKLGKEVNDLIPIMSAYQSTLSTMEQVYGKDSYKYAK